MQIIEYMDINRIVCPNNRLRAHSMHQGIRELGESIRTVGILNPLVVRPGKKGEYILISGGRRLKAAREVGLKKVPVLVIPMDEATADMYMLVENVQRESILDSDLVRAFYTRKNRDDKIAFCRVLGWNLCRIGDICRKVQGQTTAETERENHKVLGSDGIKLIDNTVKKTVQMIEAHVGDASMLRSEDEAEVAYTIRVKKPV